MNCTLCGKPVILVPSAKERAKRFGGIPSDYTRLFQEHAECVIAHNKSEVAALIARLSKPAPQGTP
jgi:hypothetical protein